MIEIFRLSKVNVIIHVSLLLTTLGVVFNIGKGLCALFNYVYNIKYTYILFCCSVFNKIKYNSFFFQTIFINNKCHSTANVNATTIPRNTENKRALLQTFFFFLYLKKLYSNAKLYARMQSITFIESMRKTIIHFNSGHMSQTYRHTQTVRNTNIRFELFYQGSFGI